MRLVDSVCILMAELVNYLLDLVMLVLDESVSYEGLELESAGLAFVVELVVEGFLNVDIHGEMFRWSAP